MNDPYSKGLWCAVIQQALTDATQPLSKRIGIRMDQLRAREWFTLPNTDFEEVCGLAGMDPDRVRKQAIALIEKAEQPKPARSKPCAKTPRPRLYEHNGQSLTLKQWATETGIHLSTIVARLRKGWSFARAIETQPTIMHRGVVRNFQKQACDRTTPAAQDSR